MQPEDIQTIQIEERDAKRELNKDADQSDVRKRPRLMRMARKLQKKGFKVTCPAEL